MRQATISIQTTVSFVRDSWSGHNAWPAALPCSWLASPVRLEEVEKWLARTGNATFHLASGRSSRSPGQGEVARVSLPEGH